MFLASLPHAFSVQQNHWNASAASVPTVKLNNGVVMPMISLGTWQYDDDTAEAAVKLALSVGYNHIDTANNYNNQAGVGKALAGVDRSSYFLTTKVPAQRSASSAYTGTTSALEENMKLLKLDAVDLVLIHSSTGSCEAMQESWRAMEDFLAAGKAKAIGVSNYCPSSFDCVLKTAKVVPALNQIQMHVGMGTDPIGDVTYADAKGIVTQAYSPLGDGTSELITGDLVTGIGKKYSKSGAQVSLHWLYQRGIALTTKSTSETHQRDNLAAVSTSWTLKDDDMATLNTAKSPKSKPSWSCTK
jgi:diketogulonate reductase-like aldo/keto reductase